jgi:hypothetical protein
MSMQGFYTVMTSVGARMGTAVIAGHAIARQCSSLEALVVDGLAVAGLRLPPPPPPPSPLPPPGFLTSLFFLLTCSPFPHVSSSSDRIQRCLKLMHIHTHMHHAHALMHTRAHMHTHACAHAYAHTYTHTHMHTRTCTHAHALTHMRTRTCTHAHAHRFIKLCTRPAYNTCAAQSLFAMYLNPKP